jgi:hypothetical protein
VISVASAKEKFAELLQADDSWKNLSDSQLTEHLAAFCAWALRDAQFKVERARQEFSASTALNRSSILAAVEDQEYLPTKAVPASGAVTVVNSGPAAVSLARHTEFLTDSGMTLALTTPAVVAAGGSEVVSVEQKKAAAYTFDVVEQVPFFECLLSADVTPDVADFSVSVTDAEGTTRNWTYYRLLQNAYPNTRAYDEFFNHLGQIGIRFGNGTFGLMPEAGSTVTVSAWETEGEVFLAAGQEVYPVDSLVDANGNEADVTAKITSAVAGGSNAEDTETIRTNLHYWPTYNEELVWDDDYVYFLKRRVPGILFCKAWGEEEAEAQAGAASLDFINRIFISAYHPDRDVQVECLAALSGVTLLNRNFQWVAVNHVTWTVTVTAEVLPDVVLAEAEADMRTALDAAYGRDSATRRDRVFLSEVYEIIRSTGYFEAGTGARFEVTTAGTTAATQLQDMVSLDLDASTFSLSYTG